MSKNNSLEISEDKTVSISYGALIFILAGAVGFAAWMTAMQINQAAFASDIKDFKQEKEDDRKIMTRMDKNITAIKTYLRIKDPRHDTD
jgi:hypothetical protein